MLFVVSQSERAYDVTTYLTQSVDIERLEQVVDDATISKRAKSRNEKTEEHMPKLLTSR